MTSTVNDFLHTKTRVRGKIIICQANKAPRFTLHVQWSFLVSLNVLLIIIMNKQISHVGETSLCV